MIEVGRVLKLDVCRRRLKGLCVQLFCGALPHMPHGPIYQHNACRPCDGKKNLLMIPNRLTTYATDKLPVSAFFYFTLMIAQASSAGRNIEPAREKINVIFSIEQSFTNSPVQQKDEEGLVRTMSYISSLGIGINTFSLFGCTQTDKSKLFAALDISRNHGIPFFLDLITSDLKSEAFNDPKSGLTAFDREHGVAISLTDLKNIKDKYGKFFRGIRLHEVSASNLTISMYKNGVDWFPNKSKFYPKDDYYDRHRLESFFLFAHLNDLKIIYSDPYWLGGGNKFLAKAFVNQRHIENDLLSLMIKYPNTVILMYANNEPLKSWSNPLHARRTDWSNILTKEMKAHAYGIGLSDQAWLCDRVGIKVDDCPPGVLTSWAESAFAQGAKWIQFEPYWYFFKYDRPSRSGAVGTSAIDQKSRGGPTDQTIFIMNHLARSESKPTELKQ